MKPSGVAGLSLIACVVFFAIDLGAQSTRDPVNVSMIQLIANPEKYDGKMVRVIGFLRLEFEGNALYLHKEDYGHSLVGNDIWVNVSPEMMENDQKLNNKYVLLEGIFDAKRHGHMGMFAGELGNIKRAEPWLAERNSGHGKKHSAGAEKSKGATPAVEVKNQ
jgi:hypothetical protein